jgi:hypothetical protein
MGRTKKTEVHEAMQIPNVRDRAFEIVYDHELIRLNGMMLHSAIMKERIGLLGYVFLDLIGRTFPVYSEDAFWHSVVSTGGARCLMLARRRLQLHSILVHSPRSRELRLFIRQEHEDLSRARFDDQALWERSDKAVDEYYFYVRALSKQQKSA